MERILNYKVSENDSGKTIEVFLKEKGCSHAVLVQLKKHRTASHEMIHGHIQTRNYVKMTNCRSD